MEVSQLLRPPSPPGLLHCRNPNPGFETQSRLNNRGNRDNRGERPPAASGSNGSLASPTTNYGSSSPFHHLTLPPLPNSHSRQNLNFTSDEETNSDGGSDADSDSDSDSNSSSGPSSTSSEVSSHDESLPTEDSKYPSQASNPQTGRSNQQLNFRSLGSSFNTEQALPSQNLTNFSNDSHSSLLNSQTGTKMRPPTTGQKRRRRDDASATPPPSSGNPTQSTQNNHGASGRPAKCSRISQELSRCLICMELHTNIVTTLCRHKYCRDCIWNWVKHRYMNIKQSRDYNPKKGLELSCPACRKAFPLHSTQDRDENLVALEFMTDSASSKRKKKTDKCHHRPSGTPHDPVEIPKGAQIINID